jgi:hypothetical protein
MSNPPWVSCQLLFLPAYSPDFSYTSLHPSGIYGIVFPSPPGRGKETNQSSREEKPLESRDVQRSDITFVSGMDKFGNKMILLLR